MARFANKTSYPPRSSSEACAPPSLVTICSSDAAVRSTTRERSAELMPSCSPARCPGCLSRRRSRRVKLSTPKLAQATRLPYLVPFTFNYDNINRRSPSDTMLLDR